MFLNEGVWNILRFRGSESAPWEVSQRQINKPGAWKRLTLFPRSVSGQLQNLSANKGIKTAEARF